LPLDYAFSFKGDIAVWAYCGHLGAWNTHESTPACSSCEAAMADENRLAEIHRLCAAISKIGVYGGSSGAGYTGLLVRYFAIGGRAAMLLARHEEAAWLLRFADLILVALDSDNEPGVVSPLRIGLDELLRDFEESSGNPLSFYTDTRWVEVEKKDPDGEPEA
jgi:hypothetical protein